MYVTLPSFLLFFIFINKLNWIEIWFSEFCGPRTERERKRVWRSYFHFLTFFPSFFKWMKTYTEKGQRITELTSHFVHEHCIRSQLSNCNCWNPVHNSLIQMKEEKSSAIRRNPMDQVTSNEFKKLEINYILMFWQFDPDSSFLVLRFSNDLFCNFVIMWIKCQFYYYLLVLIHWIRSRLNIFSFSFPFSFHSKFECNNDVIHLFISVSSRFLSRAFSF